ncbi:hypothetical protein FOA52_001264 [Chlamydomonas sp. UWO 241]|nr:hypothetical protein FOA52_001264 [Chlamydomonas sp. UWO 241]
MGGVRVGSSSSSSSMPSFHHPLKKVVVAETLKDPGFKGSAAHGGLLACAVCCLCGQGTRVDASSSSKAWLQVQPSPALLLRPSNQRRNSGSCLYRAGPFDLGCGPFHTVWARVIEEHGPDIAPLYGLEGWCHYACGERVARAAAGGRSVSGGDESDGEVYTNYYSTDSPLHRGGEASTSSRPPSHVPSGEAGTSSTPPAVHTSATLPPYLATAGSDGTGGVGDVIELLTQQQKAAEARAAAARPVREAIRAAQEAARASKVKPSQLEKQAAAGLSASSNATSGTVTISLELQLPDKPAVQQLLHTLHRLSSGLEPYREGESREPPPPEIAKAAADIAIAAGRMLIPGAEAAANEIVHRLLTTQAARQRTAEMFAPEAVWPCVDIQVPASEEDWAQGTWGFLQVTESMLRLTIDLASWLNAHGGLMRRPEGTPPPGQDELPALAVGSMLLQVALLEHLPKTVVLLLDILNERHGVSPDDLLHAPGPGGWARARATAPAAAPEDKGAPPAALGDGGAPPGSGGAHGGGGGAPLGTGRWWCGGGGGAPPTAPARAGSGNSNGSGISSGSDEDALPAARAARCGAAAAAAEDGGGGGLATVGDLSLPEQLPAAAAPPSLSLLHNVIKCSGVKMISMVCTWATGRGGAADWGVSGPCGLTPLHLAALLPNSAVIVGGILDECGAPAAAAWLGCAAADGATPADYGALYGLADTINVRAAGLAPPGTSRARADAAPPAPPIGDGAHPRAAGALVGSPLEAELQGYGADPIDAAQVAASAAAVLIEENARARHAASAIITFGAAASDAAATDGGCGGGCDTDEDGGVEGGSCDGAEGGGVAFEFDDYLSRLERERPALFWALMIASIALAMLAMYATPM